MPSSSTTTTNPFSHNNLEFRRQSTRKFLFGLFVSMLALSYLVVVNHNRLQKPKSDREQLSTTTTTLASLDIKLKPEIRRVLLEKAMLQDKDNIKWQRSAYHFQTHKNFISDPNGPLYHMGWYHLFYQYNPDSAIWGNMSWGHAVSKDLINWFRLPIAMAPDHWYDINGVMTGSATILPNGEIIMFYSGNANDQSQLQCLAYPANSSDPLLIEWIKYDKNPVLYPPPNIGAQNLRDPSSMWMGPDGKYRMVMGSKQNNTIGCVFVFHTKDFYHYELLEEVLHSVPGTGMWECVDIYPLSTTHKTGLDMSYNVINGSSLKYLLKQSGDEDRHDWYAIGSYDPFKDKWYPDDLEMDLGIGYRYDYGKFYASKTFYDPRKKRRVLWGYVGETDTRNADLSKGWANMMNCPRSVWLDLKTQSNLIQWPVKEVKKLRYKEYDEFKDVELQPGSIVPLNIDSATQLDIVATFKIDRSLLDAAKEADMYNCTTSEGSATRGSYGPFGLLVLANEKLSELTPVYFYIAKNTDDTLRTYFCTDESRSSHRKDVVKRMYGTTVPVLNKEKHRMRILLDHSIIESFAQRGRAVITSRVYPTKAIYEDAKIFLFNNATDICVKASLKIWKMNGIKFRHFPL